MEMIHIVINFIVMLNNDKYNSFAAFWLETVDKKI
jgi:hypothetical protein